MMTRKETLARIQQHAQALGRSIPRATLAPLSDADLREIQLRFREEADERRRLDRKGGRPIAGQIQHRWQPKIGNAPRP